MFWINNLKSRRLNICPFDFDWRKLSCFVIYVRMDHLIGFIKGVITFERIEDVLEKE